MKSTIIDRCLHHPKPVVGWPWGFLKDEKQPTNRFVESLHIPLPLRAARQFEWSWICLRWVKSWECSIASQIRWADVPPMVFPFGAYRTIENPSSGWKTPWYGTTGRPPVWFLNSFLIFTLTSGTSHHSLGCSTKTGWCC